MGIPKLIHKEKQESIIDTIAHKMSHHIPQTRTPKASFVGKGKTTITKKTNQCTNPIEKGHGNFRFQTEPGDQKVATITYTIAAKANNSVAEELYNRFFI